MINMMNIYGHHYSIDYIYIEYNPFVSFSETNQVKIETTVVHYIMLSWIIP